MNPIDEYHSRVYRLKGAVTTSTDDAGAQTFGAVSLPGMITKHEPIEIALLRLDQYQENRKRK